MDGNEEDPCLSKWQPEFSVELIDADNTERGRNFALSQLEENSLVAIR